MTFDNIKEQSGPKPVIARQKGKLGAVMIDPKTGKPIPDTWIPKEKVPQSALKYLDPAKFSAAEKRNKDRQAQIEAEKQRLKGVGTTSTTPATPSTTPSAPPSSRSTPTPTPQKPKTSSATTPTAEKIKGGLEVYKQQVKSGDIKGAEATGKSTWALANPTLAAAAAEKARIRGTQQTDNPLMKDMRSRLPMNSPSVQSPDIAKLASNPTTLAGNQSLVNNPNAFKAATAKSTAPVPPKSSDISVSKNSQVNKSAETLAKTPFTNPPLQTKPNLYGTTMGAGPTYRGGPVPPPIKDKVKKEAYDIVLDYILSEGHADTLSEAHYVMMQMDEDHIQNIVEFE